MKNILTTLLTLFLFGISYGQLTEASITKEWKVKEVISMTPPPGTKSPSREKAAKEMFLRGSFSIKKDHSFSCDLGDFSIPDANWLINTKTGEVEVIEKSGPEKDALLTAFSVKFLSSSNAIFTFPDGDVVMFVLRVEAK